MKYSNSVDYNRAQVLNYNKYFLLFLPGTSRIFHLEVHKPNAFIRYASCPARQLKNIKFISPLKNC